MLVGAAVVAANLYFKRDKGLTVTTDVIKTRDLEAIVSASGKIQPKRLVNISAETPGRVVDLAVNEGDRITKGQFLLQIDPKSLRTRVEGDAASLEVGGRVARRSCGRSVETARVQVEQAQQNLTRQRDLWAQQLTTREALEKAENDVRTARVGAAGAREAGDLAEQPHLAGAGDARQRALRPDARCAWSRRSTASSRGATSSRAKPR